MILLKSTVKEGAALMVAEKDDEIEVLRYFWNNRALRNIIGIYKMVTISILNEKEAEVIKMKQKFPTAVGYILMWKA